MFEAALLPLEAALLSFEEVLFGEGLSGSFGALSRARESAAGEGFFGAALAVDVVVAALAVDAALAPGAALGAGATEPDSAGALAAGVGPAGGSVTLAGSAAAPPVSAPVPGPASETSMDVPVQ